MAGGNGKGDGKVIVLRPEAKTTMIDELNDVFAERSRKLEDNRPRRSMGTFDEDPYIATLAAQYKAFMDRRELRLKYSQFYLGHLSFEDYLEIRGEM